MTVAADMVKNILLLVFMPQNYDILLINTTFLNIFIKHSVRARCFSVVIGTKNVFKTTEETIKLIYLLAMNIKPLADRVLIEPAAAEEVTVGGIIIPDSAKEKPLKGTVVAAGDGTKDEKMQLKEGDTVLYGKYAGTELELEGKKYLIMRQSDVLAIINK